MNEKNDSKVKSIHNRLPYRPSYIILYSLSYLFLYFLETCGGQRLLLPGLSFSSRNEDSEIEKTSSKNAITIGFEREKINEREYDVAGKDIK